MRICCKCNNNDLFDNAKFSRNKTLKKYIGADDICTKCVPDVLMEFGIHQKSVHDATYKNGLAKAREIFGSPKRVSLNSQTYYENI